MAGELLVVASGKGGVGKTVTAVNLSVALRLEGRSVVLVDGDLGMPNVADLFGIDPGTTLHDVLAGDAAPSDGVVREARGFGVLPGDCELEGFASADPARFAYVTDRLARQYDYVVMDTGGGLSYESALPLELADDVLFVTTPDPHAVGDTERTRALVDLVDGPPGDLLVTMADERTDARAVAREVGADLLGVVPRDQAVAESVRAGRPLEVYAPESAAARAYRSVAADVDEKAAREDAVLP